MNILIDARLYGPKHTGNGRYTQELINNLAKIDSKNTYFLLLRLEDYENLRLPSNFVKVLSDFKHYSFVEQFKLPFILYKLKPDIVHFPHFNVPLLYFGRFIVTIHDMIMHKFKGGTATTRGFIGYWLFRIGYHLAFAKAVYRSQKIIVPSEFVKNEIIKFYKVSKKKIHAIYE